MTTLRRRIVRPILPTPIDAELQRRLQKQRQQLEAERKAYKRWMSRLRRAFNSIEKIQRRIDRLERQLNPRETT